MKSKDYFLWLIFSLASVKSVKIIFLCVCVRVDLIHGFGVHVNIFVCMLVLVFVRY